MYIPAFLFIYKAFVCILFYKLIFISEKLDMSPYPLCLSQSLSHTNTCILAHKHTTFIFVNPDLIFFLLRCNYLYLSFIFKKDQREG